MSERGREAHTEFWEGSEGPSGSLGGDERPTRKFGKGLEAHQWFREGSGGPPKGLVVVQEAHP